MSASLDNDKVTDVKATKRLGNWVGVTHHKRSSALNKDLELREDNCNAITNPELIGFLDCDRPKSGEHT